MEARTRRSARVARSPRVGLMRPLGCTFVLTVPMLATLAVAAAGAPGAGGAGRLQRRLGDGHGAIPGSHDSDGHDLRHRAARRQRSGSVATPGPGRASSAPAWEEAPVARKLKPVHPGEVLLEDFLRPLGLTQYRLAKSLSVPPRRINEIVLGKPAVSADPALRLARFFGTSDRFWLNLQTSTTWTWSATDWQAGLSRKSGSSARRAEKAANAGLPFAVPLTPLRTT